MCELLSFKCDVADLFLILDEAKLAVSPICAKLNQQSPGSTFIFNFHMRPYDHIS